MHAGSAAGKSLVKLSGRVTGSDAEVAIYRPEVFYPISGLGQQQIAAASGKNGVIDLEFELDKPEILVMTYRMQNWKLLFSPGDSLKFTIVANEGGAKLHFDGRNAKTFNLFVILTGLNSDLPKYFRFDDILDYKAALNQWKTKAEHIVAEFSDSSMVGPVIKMQGLNIIKYKYLNSIYFPQEFIPAESAAKLDADLPDDEKFDQDHLLMLNEYRIALYSKYIARYNNKDFKMSSAAVYGNIRDNLKGKSRVFAIANFIGEYVKKQSPDDAAIIKDALRLVRKSHLDSGYMSYLQENEMKYFILNKPLPDDVLKRTLVSAYGDERKLPLDVVLNKFQGKGLYIDLWASWCAPCRADIKQSSGTKSMLAGHGFEYVYFSIDTDVNSWKTASRQEKITENQYILDMQAFADFRKFLGQLSVPRYLILDKNHKIKSLYAPSPVDADSDAVKRIIDGL